MEPVTLKGNLTLHVDDSALEARLLFVPQPDGEEWNREKVLTLLAQEGIIYGFTPSSVAAHLKALGNPADRSLETREIVIARGDPPELPVKEEYGWEDLPIPGELQEAAKALLKIDEAPVIEILSTEKVKKEKIVKKKSKLPFVPDKEEKVSVFETVETPRRVYLDPEIVATGYIEEGGRLATAYTAKPGKPGKDIYARPTTPQQDAEPPLYLGKNVEKGKGELVAAITGFVRRGKNWVEVVSFEDHDWKLEFSKDNATCFLHFDPGTKDAPIPDAEDVIEDARVQGYSVEALIPKEEIQALLGNAVKTMTPVVHRQICQDRDASVELIISDDKTKASLNVLKGRGRGQALVLKEVSSVIRDAKLKGIQTEKIKDDIISFYRSKEHHLIDYLLAEGALPEATGVAETDCIVTFPSREEMEKLKALAQKAPPENLAGIESLTEFPFEEVAEIGPVLRHQPVAKIIPPKPAAPGTDVFGKALETAPMEDPPLKLFENCTIDQNTVVADIAGVLDKALKEGILYLRVRPHRDGEVEVSLSEDKMTVYLNLFPPDGTGVAVTFQDVKEQLKERGVVKGIDDQKIQEAAAGAASGETLENLVIGEGKQPRDAVSNKLEILTDIATGKKVTIKKNGSADYKTQDTITVVTRGQVVAKMFPPDETPEDGWDVFGKEIKAKDVTASPVEIGKHIEQKRLEDGTVELIAATSGELVYDHTVIDIRNLHTVEGDVNLQTGNIKFSGSVQVKGMVESGFQVFSGEDIQIGESVEGALISAENDIVIERGIIGRQKGVIRAKGNIQASFVENARLLAVKDIHIKGYCLRSHLKSNGKVILEGEKGFFMGGSVKARAGMDVTDLGSEQELKTLVSFGQDYLVEDQIELEEREIQKIKNKLVKFDTYMNSLEKQHNRSTLERVRREKLKFLKILEKRSLRLFSLREKFEEHVASEITVRDSVYPGVIIESHGRTHEIKKKRSGVVFLFDKESGHIYEKDIDKKE